MPDVLAAHDLYPRVRERFQPRHAVIGRAIIDDDQLPAFKRLRADRFDRLAQVWHAIVGRHDDRDLRRIRRGLVRGSRAHRVALHAVNPPSTSPKTARARTGSSHRGAFQLTAPARMAAGTAPITAPSRHLLMV